jgi:hypothetical protein
MPLLHLPPELFAPIIAQAIGYRLVCSMFKRGLHTSNLLNFLETFDSHVIGYHVEAACTYRLAEIFKHPLYKHIFAHHGSTILSAKVLLPTAVPVEVASFVNQSIAFLLEHQEAGDKSSDRIHDQYKSDICKAMMAVEPVYFWDYLTGREKPDREQVAPLLSPKDLLTPLAAAIGHIDLLQDSLSLSNLSLPYTDVCRLL